MIKVILRWPILRKTSVFSAWVLLMIVLVCSKVKVSRSLFVEVIPLSQINFKPSNPGTETVPKFRGVVQPDGDVKLVKDGVRYLYDEIQSYKEECDINNIVKRYLNGDVNALGSLQATAFMDLTKMPQTRQEALQSIMDAQRYFVELPAEVREKFGNSWEQFYMAGDTKEFAQAISDYFVGLADSSLDPAPVEESKE